MIPRTVKIGNVHVSDISQNNILQLVNDAILKKRKFNITYINAYSIVVAQQDKEYLHALQHIPCQFPDGIGIRIAAGVLSQKFTEKYNATDFNNELLSVISKKNWKIFLFGSSDSTLKIINEKYCQLNIVGLLNGYSDISEPQKVVERINKADPDILFVALGVPKQEIWISTYASALHVPIVLCVGNFIEFLAGTIPRAPLWMQNIGLEWFHRLIHEPRRLFKRYVFGIPHFCWIVLKQKFSIL